MNILMLSWRGPGHPLAGGAEKVTLKHCQKWASSGHTVYWFTSSVPGLPPTEIINGVNVVRSGSMVFGVQIKACVWYLLKPHPNFDLIIDQFHGLPFFSPLYSRAQILAFIHEIAREVWQFNPWPGIFNKIATYLGKSIEPLIFKMYSKHVFWTVSESTARDLRSFGIKNIVVIPNGTEAPVLNRKFSKTKEFTALHLSELTMDKGVLDSIRSFQKFNHSHPKSTLWIVGKGKDSFIDSLKREINSLGIDKSVVWWGYVSDRKKYELLSKSWVLLNPSVHEGWGLTNLEANSVGTPVIGYLVSGMRDSVIDQVTGFLVPRGDIDGLVNSMRKVYELTPKNFFRKPCIKWSKKFTWEKSVSASLDLISTYEKEN